MEKKYFVFGRASSLVLWDVDDLKSIINAVNDYHADLFVYDPLKTQIHEVLEAYSKWSDYAYISCQQNEEIVRQL